jgi:hypothetical protein
MSRENYVFQHPDGTWRVCVGGNVFDVQYSTKGAAQYALSRELHIKDTEAKFEHG